MIPFCPTCGEPIISIFAKYCHNCGEALSESINSLRLLRHAGLEDSSLKKLKSYEDWYIAAYSYNGEKTGIDFREGLKDHSHMVTILSTIIEIELSVSLKPFALRILADNNPDEVKDEVKRWKCNINTLGDCIHILNNDTFTRFISTIEDDRIRSIVSNKQDIFELLSKLRKKRNEGGHKTIINRADFYVFYQGIYLPFFNNYLPSFIQLKRFLFKENLS